MTRPAEKRDKTSSSTKGIRNDRTNSRRHI
jgi:hypothetical protein